MSFKRHSAESKSTASLAEYKRDKTRQDDPVESLQGQSPGLITGATGGNNSMVAPQLLSSTTDEWATPQDLFDKLDACFHFTLDPCATDENHKAPKYFTRAQDGLKQDWGGGYMVQSTLRPSNRGLDQEMRRTSRSGSHANPSKNRHQMVARLHRQEPECQRPLHQRTAQVRRSEKSGTIPERNRNFYKLEDITWQMIKTWCHRLTS